jgi:uncharacterized membrane protein YccC
VLLSPRGDLAYSSGVAFTLGTAISILCAAIIKFAVLPGLETFSAFCIAIGVYLVPIGVGLAQCKQPAILALFTGMVVNFIPVLSPANQMSYDTAQFYNLALAIFVGCGAGAFSFRLVPFLSPAVRTRRLLASALRDLRRLSIGPIPPTSDAWEGRMYGRLAALPDEAEPVQRAQLLTTLSVGSEIFKLRRIASRHALGSELDAALAAVAQGNSALATTCLARLDEQLVSPSGRGTLPSVQTRASILAVSEALAQHSLYFDAGAPA